MLISSLHHSFAKEVHLHKIRSKTSEDAKILGCPSALQNWYHICRWCMPTHILYTFSSLHDSYVETLHVVVILYQRVFKKFTQMCETSTTGR